MEIEKNKMLHNMEEDGGVFSFEHDEDFVQIVGEKGGKKGGSGGYGLKPYCHNVCDSRLANFENEEFVTLRPRNSFSYDISAFGSSGASSSGSDSNEPDSDGGLSILMGKISLGHDHMDGSNNNDTSACACCLSLSFEDRMTIEGLRAHLYSCFTCGVQWKEEQISLDCNECDGYALSRPCLKCEGQCQSIWTRDVSKSHSLGRATWAGVCSIEASAAEKKSENKK